MSLPSTSPSSTPRAPTVLEHRLQIPASPSRVWRALLDPDFAPRWLGGFRLVSDWRLGGPFAIRGRLGEGDYEEAGVIRRLEPGRLLEADHWSPLWGLPDAPPHRAVLCWTLEPEGAGTALTLQHRLPPVTALAEHARFFGGVSLAALAAALEG